MKLCCVLQLSLWFVTLWESRREIVECAAVRVIVCYKVRVETEGIGDVCCS